MSLSDHIWVIERDAGQGWHAYKFVYGGDLKEAEATKRRCKHRWHHKWRIRKYVAQD
jgi:hypothetical protein